MRTVLQRISTALFLLLLIPTGAFAQHTVTASEDQTLVFSYPSCTSVEQKVGKHTVINVKMER